VNGFHGQKCDEYGHQHVIAPRSTSKEPIRTNDLDRAENHEAGSNTMSLIQEPLEVTLDERNGRVVRILPNFFPNEQIDDRL
jgi:hypothetical protein